MTTMRRAAVAAAAVALALSCSDGPGVIRVDDSAWVGGIAFIDRDGDGQLTAADGVAAGVLTALVVEASGDTVARATSRADGTFAMSRIPAGRYRLVASRGAAGDTVDVLHIDSARITLAARDSVARSVRLGYPRTTVAGARGLPPGRRVTMEGIALNGWSTFGDSVVHFTDATGSMRAIRTLPGPVQAGDSITLVGTTGVASGHTVLVDARAHVAAPARGLPPLDSIPTAVAATAADGVRADGHVRIGNALIVDTARVFGDRILGVNDGSGRVEVVLDAQVAFDPGPYVPGGTIRAAGVLAPDPGGTMWRLKPRERNDLAVTFTTTPIAQARSLPQGQQAVIEGVALNSWAAFGDSTVHVVDPTGTLRATRVVGANQLAAGDSVRLVGTMTLRDGQPVLGSATAMVLVQAVGLPLPDSISTQRVRTADGGTRDAGLVRAAGMIIGSQQLPGGDRLLTFNDGSGPAEVLIRGAFAGTFNAGSILSATGVLVPTAGGTWRLRTRSGADASASFESVTIAQARALPAGRIVQIRGIALNGWVTFGDGSVHLQDNTGTIRVINLPFASIFQGDSIRITGTVTARNGQPVLSGSGADILLAGIGTATPDSVSTETAASAQNGARDAGQVRIRGTISDASQSGGDLLLTVSDGSGDLVVRLDVDVGFPIPGAWKAGDIIRARGVLVPASDGASWELKPRALTEIAVVGGG